MDTDSKQESRAKEATPGLIMGSPADTTRPLTPLEDGHSAPSQPFHQMTIIEQDPPAKEATPGLTMGSPADTARTLTPLKDGHIAQSQPFHQMTIIEHDPPVTFDGGYGWVVVAASFLIQFIRGGIALSLGLYLVKFAEEFGSSRMTISWVSALFNGLPFFFGTIFSAISNKIGSRASTITGALLMTIATLAAPFCKRITTLVFVLGLIGGAGAGLMYISSVVIVGYYFQRKRSLALGIASSSVGIGSIVFPIFIDFLLERYGWKDSMWILSGILLQCVVAGALLRPITDQDLKKLRSDWNKTKSINGSKDACHDRENDLSSNVSDFNKTQSHNGGATETKLTAKGLCFSLKESLSLMRNPVVAIFAVSYFFSYSGYYFPHTYLPDHAIQMGVEPLKAAFLLSIAGITLTLSQFVIGWLCDRPWCDPLFIHSLCVTLAGLGAIVLPHLQLYGLLCGYATVVGLQAGMSGVLSPLISAQLVGVDKMAGAFGLMLSLGGVMNIFGMPLAGWLYDVTGSYDLTFYLFGSLILFAGLLTFPLRCFIKFLDRKGKLN